MKKILLSITILATTFLIGCGEEHSFLTNVAPSDGARVKFIHAAPDAPGVAIFVNDKKVSGLLTVAPATPGVITYGGVFPSQDYAVLPAGAAKVKVTAPSMSDAVVMQGDTPPLESGKYYSVFATGLAPNYLPVVVQDVIPNPSGNNVFIRLINLVPNSTDADVSILGATLISGVKTGQGGDKFVAYELPAYTGGTVSFSVAAKANGNSTSTTAGTVSSTSTINFTGYNPSRALTIVLRGVLATQDKDATGKIVAVASKFPMSSTSYINR